MSKQPMFKSGAVSITKARLSSNSKPKIIIPAQQYSSVSEVESNKLNVVATADENLHKTLQRQLPHYISATIQSLNILLDIYTTNLPPLFKDLEMHAAIPVLHSIASSILERVEPVMKKYADSSSPPFESQSSHNPPSQHPSQLAVPPSQSHSTPSSHLSHEDPQAKKLRDLLFPSSSFSFGKAPPSPLTTLSNHKIYLSHLSALLLTLQPAAAAPALWDAPFAEAVGFAIKQLERLEAWGNFQLNARAPQGVLVPLPI
jgi:hypothetical protein